MKTIVQSHCCLFDKAWHEGFFFKLKPIGISGNLWNVITIFLYQRKQRVVLNGQHFSWTNTEVGVPQGSILGSLFFLVYINDLSDCLTSNPKSIADDTSLFSVIHNINSPANDLNGDLTKISYWAFQSKMKFTLINRLKRWFSVEKLMKLIILRYILIKT